ncbi:MAG: monofunctional biosynthetic peptidoglycan transglycosylase [Pseudomonadota bacterium]
MASKTKKPTSRKPRPKKKTRNRRTLFGFLWRFCLAVFCLVTFVPLALLLLYRIEGVHPISTLMIHDRLVGPGAERQWVDFEDISPHIYRSVLSSEDGKFCSHDGVDWEALNSVIEDAIDGERTRGASTITMQLVKNLFLWPDRSFLRKGLEIPYALMAETVLSKKRIMEIYLNIAELDNGVFGVEAAAQNYFKRSAKSLGPGQSALLTVTLPNPKKRNAAMPSRGMNRLAGIIRKRARASGAYIKCLQ